MRVLIPNADDFGLSPGVNAGVLVAYRQGIVRSASLMVTTPSAPQAVELAAEHGLELGLHLSLTTGHPVSPPERVPSLTGAQGRFHTLGGLTLRLAVGRVRPEDLERELQAQLERALALQVRLAHLDSHHHVHAHPLVASVALRLATAHGLPLRCPVEPPRASRPRDLARALLLLGPAWRLRRRARALRIPTSDHFRGLSLGYGFDASALAAVVRALPEGVTELMCHPGHPDAQLAAFTHYVAGRERELAALTDPRVRQLLDELGVALMGWSEAVRHHG